MTAMSKKEVEHLIYTSKQFFPNPHMSSLYYTVCMKGETMDYHGKAVARGTAVMSGNHRGLSCDVLFVVPSACTGDDPRQDRKPEFWAEGSTQRIDKTSFRKPISKYKRVYNDWVEHPVELSIYGVFTPSHHRSQL